MNAIKQKRLLKIEEASEYLSISKKGLYNMIYRREIPFVKIKGRIRFDIIDLDKWIEENKINDAEALLNEVIKV